MSGLAVAILAAGRSARFGTEDKLAALFRGKPLGLHTAEALTGLEFGHRWVIARTADHMCVPGWTSAGFETVVNADAAQGMGSSLRCAVERAKEAGAEGLMVCLADMPLVPPVHFSALVRAWSEHGGLVASQDGALVSPPAIFSREQFGALLGLTGDQGAKPLLKTAYLVTSPPAALVDVDDPETLRRLSSQSSF
jgi:CTP:molybdopterin cytidylyltransferase MocA